MAQEVIDQVRAVAEGKNVMVTLDSGHHAAHVILEMEVYCLMVSVGSYCIVEVRDFISALSSPPAHCIHPPQDKKFLRSRLLDFGTHQDTKMSRWHSSGPLEAVKSFLLKHPEFEVRRTERNHFDVQYLKASNYVYLIHGC